MELINGYLYGCGTSTELINIPEEIYLNLVEAKNELTKTKRERLVPKFIGVYQVKSTMIKKGDIEEATFFSMNEILKSGLETKMAIETARALGKNATTIQPSMISILYDSRQETADSVKYLFDDQLQRTSIYSINGTPNFSNKDTSLKELILGNIKEIVANDNVYGEQVRLLRTNLKLMENERKKFGLTLEEWMFLNNSKVIWGEGSNIQNQRKMIKEIRKSYRHIERNE